MKSSAALIESLWLKLGHCALMPDVRYGTAMTRKAISAVYYYPDEVGIG